jgi:protein gp37
MGKTTIEWTDYSFNPWWGCTKVSPGCDHCYAEAGAVRYGWNVWGKDATRRFFSEKHWQEPLRWNEKAARELTPIRVFAGSYCDVMEDRRDLDDPRRRLFELIEATNHITWQLVTKRPQNYRRFLPAPWIQQPRQNVWLLTTVEAPEYLWRVDSLKACPAIVHGLSIEPLINDIPTIGQYLYDIEWMIVGGESGVSRHAVRPMPLTAARRMRDESLARAIPFFLKQWGNMAPRGNDLIYIRSKTEAGCLLDGQEWKQFPN